MLRTHAALWEADVDPAGFHWIDTNDSDQSAVSFIRFDAAGEGHVVCVLNATQVPRGGYRLGVPSEGVYREVINTNASLYGGSGVGNFGQVTAAVISGHGFPASIVLALPPLGVL